MIKIKLLCGKYIKRVPRDVIVRMIIVLLDISVKAAVPSPFTHFGSKFK